MALSCLDRALSLASDNSMADVWYNIGQVTDSFALIAPLRIRIALLIAWLICTHDTHCPHMTIGIDQALTHDSLHSLQVAIGIGDLGLAYQAFKIAISVDSSHAESYANLGVLELVRYAWIC